MPGRLKPCETEYNETTPLLSSTDDSDPYGNIRDTKEQKNETSKNLYRVESTKNGEQSQELHMLRLVNLSSATIYMLGSMIGSGIFVSPIVFILGVHSVGMSLIIWVVTGLHNLCFTFVYMELGTMYPKTGADYNYLKNILGSAPAFLFVWTHLLFQGPSLNALLTITTYDYLFYQISDKRKLPEASRMLFCISLVVLIIVVNSTYTKYVTKFQTFFTVAKILGMLLIIVIGIVQLAAGKTEILATGFQNTNTDPSAYANAMYAGLFTYGGWQFVFIIMEEVQNPEKVAPQATIISMLSVTLLYTFTNVAYFTVLTPEEMMASSAVAVTFAEKTIGKYSAVIPILVACSTIGALNGSIMGASRVYFAAARDNLFPCIFSAINIKYYTPWPSLIITGLATIIYILTGSAVTLIEYVGFIGMITFGLTSFCTVYLRFKDPHRHRPFKAPIVLSILVVLVNGGLIVLGLYNSPKQYGIGLLLILSGVPVYLFIQYCHNKPKALIRFHHSFTAFVEKVLLVFPSDK